MKQDMIVILDLGSTENTVLARAIRALGVYSEIYPHDITAAELTALPNVKGVIINGGPNHVIDGYKRNFTDLDALAQSTFLDMFGDVAINDKSWDIIPMGQLGDFKNGLNYNKGEKGKTLKIIGVGDFQNLKTLTLFDNIPSIEVESISQEYLLQNEDIVFVRSNGNKNLVGRCLEVYPNKEEVTFSGFCIRFRKSADIVNKYLVALLTNTGFKKVHILKSNGIGIQNINQKLLGNLPIPVPPIDLQKRFAMQLMAERMQYYFS